MSQVNASVDELFDLFASPIAFVKQVARQNVAFDQKTGFPDLWGGQNSVFVIEFETKPIILLLLADIGSSMACRIVSAEDRLQIADEVVAFAEIVDDKEFDEHNFPEFRENLSGLFDLAVAIEPVCGAWSEIRITEAVVATRANESANNLIGFCLWINLGLRIGFFVGPDNGLTLLSNDVCDHVVSQAYGAAKRGLLRVDRREYPGRETPGRFHEINWFEWLEQ